VAFSFALNITIMNISELDSYNLADAVKFNEQLNPRIWQGNKMRPQVRAKLLQIAEDFKQSLGIGDLNVKDITLSGSNASYTYTPHSDIDLHLVVDLPQADVSEVYRELFDAKKFQYNETHNIKIGGYDVELYVENANKPAVSQGMFSVLNDDWINIPLKKRSTVNDTAVKSKYDVIKHRIESAVKSANLKRLTNTAAKIKKMRQAGLDAHGELGPENIAYKMLRSQGVIQQLYDARTAAKDRALSLKERTIEIDKPFKFTYGFKATEDVGASWDGVSPTTQMFLNEEPKSDEDILTDFVEFCVAELPIEQMPRIRLRKDPQWPVRHKTFGRYNNDEKMLEVAWGQRHIMDVLRTVAHELTHKHQHERDGSDMGSDAGETGSPYENEANARAGVLMRDYAKLHPEYFAAGQADDLAEASGYIPTKKQARDPRFSMALTKDVRPGAVGKEANKLGLKTDSQGHPGLLMTGLANALREFKETGKTSGKSYGYNSTPLSQVPGEREDELGNQEATGPEFPPEMPAGTTKIDVTDLTDWYRLGMDISDLDDADPADYNQGPPQTVVVFPSDEAEQGYLKQFKRLGLKTHDIDPDVEGGEDVTDKHQPKTDEDLIAEGIDDMLFEINMSTGSLRREAAKTGAIAGMEFEMIVPNVEGGDDDGDMEADYSLDEGITSIQEAYDFFYDGDYNSRGDVTRLRDKMQNEYYEWLSEQFDSRWDSDESEFVYNYIKENASTEEIAEILGIELDADNYPDTVDRQAYRDATDKVVEEGYGNYWYDQARESAQEDFNQNADLESEWLESRDLNTMQDIENEYNMNWPHWYSQGGGEASIEDVANEFQDAIGRDVRASGNYHSGGVTRPSPTAQHYIVEPDGSLEADDNDDVGLEFVSPPLPIDEILSDLNKVKQWAKVYGCYTNDSTGLHINISVPNYSRENLDFVKLALLMGDEYVLDNFGRAGNTYAKSAMKLVRDQVRQKPDEAERLLDKMKGNLDSLASKAIHSGVTSKYTSINTKDGHIEFRSPGGDWLDENFDKIENTLLRFTVAMSAALNPEMYREEYLKKLYKLLTQDDKGSDTIKYFSEYVAGKIPAAALRSFVKQAQLERKLKQGDTEGKKYWWRVGRPGFGASVEVVATSKEEAIEKGKAEYPDWADAKDMTAKPLSPYNEPPIKDPTGDAELDSIHQELGLQAPASYEIYNRQTGNSVEDAPARVTNDAEAIAHLEDYFEHGPHGLQPTQAARMFSIRSVRRQASPTAPRGREYQIFDQNSQQTAAAFLAPSDEAALARLLQYQRSHPDDPYGVRTANGVEVVDIDMPIAPGRAATSPTGQWKIVDGLNREVFRFRPAENTRAKANELAAVWARENNFDGNYQVEPAEEAQSGSTTDLAQQRAVPGTFTGAWRVVDSDTGQELYRFSGIGNRQADANRVAADWLRQNGPEDANMTEIEVLPIVS